MKLYGDRQVKDRIVKLLNDMNMSVRSFEMSIGVSNGYVGKLKFKPSERVVSKILSEYPFVRREWLLNGVGDMYSKRAVNTSQASIVVGSNNQNSTTNIDNNNEIVELLKKTIEDLRANVKMLQDLHTMDQDEIRRLRERVAYLEGNIVK